VVASGTLDDRYTGTTINFVQGPASSKVQIDHVVALAAAWRAGARPWTAGRRLFFECTPWLGSAVVQPRVTGPVVRDPAAAAGTNDCGRRPQRTNAHTVTTSRATEHAPLETWIDTLAVGRFPARVERYRSRRDEWLGGDARSYHGFGRWRDCASVGCSARRRMPVPRRPWRKSHVYATATPRRANRSRILPNPWTVPGPTGRTLGFPSPAGTADSALRETRRSNPHLREGRGRGRRQRGNLRLLLRVRIERLVDAYRDKEGAKADERPRRTDQKLLRAGALC
jgi:hypothetical protein